MQDIAQNKPKYQGMMQATARIAIASFFIGKAAGLIIDPNGMGQMMAQGELPGYLVWPNIAFEFLAAFSIMIGLHTRLAAALLALYLFWSSFLFNYAPGNGEAINTFWRDLAMIGGLLLLFAHGRGAYAFDNVLARKEAEAKENKARELDAEKLEYAEFEPYPAQ